MRFTWKLFFTLFLNEVSFLNFWKPIAQACVAFKVKNVFFMSCYFVCILYYFVLYFVRGLFWTILDTFGVWVGLRFVIVALPGLFSYLFFFFFFFFFLV